MKVRTDRQVEDLIEGYHDWLSEYRWIWFGTLTFRGFPPISKARHCFNRWIDELRENDGDRDFRWFRVTERGAEGCNIHFHVLVGGLVSGNRYPWMFRWDKIAGEANIAYFNSHKGGIYYILKTLTHGQDFDIDFHLQPVRRPHP